MSVMSLMHLSKLGVLTLLLVCQRCPASTKSNAVPPTHILAQETTITDDEDYRSSGDHSKTDVWSVKTPSISSKQTEERSTLGAVATAASENTSSLWLIVGSSVGGGVLIALIGITLGCVIAHVKQKKHEGGESTLSLPSACLRSQASPGGEEPRSCNSGPTRSNVAYDQPTTSLSFWLEPTKHSESDAVKNAVPMYESMAYGDPSCQPMTMTRNCAYGTAVGDGNA